MPRADKVRKKSAAPPLKLDKVRKEPPNGRQGQKETRHPSTKGRQGQEETKGRQGQKETRHPSTKGRAGQEGPKGKQGQQRNPPKGRQGQETRHPSTKGRQGQDCHKLSMEPIQGQKKTLPPEPQPKSQVLTPNLVQCSNPIRFGESPLTKVQLPNIPKPFWVQCSGIKHLGALGLEV